LPPGSGVYQQPCLRRGALANTSYHVSLSTDVLNASPASAPYSLDFIFIQGGTPNANTVTLTDFQYGSNGMATGSPSYFGGGSGDLASGVSISDTAFYNEFTQSFQSGDSPGGLLTFTLSTTTAPDAGAPDEFSFYLLDSSGNVVLTSDFLRKLFDDHRFKLRNSKCDDLPRSWGLSRAGYHGDAISRRSRAFKRREPGLVIADDWRRNVASEKKKPF
jgi:hypothetical protein